MFGYFPSYMLGNLYSAQIFAQVNKEIPDLCEHIVHGDLASLLGWLREKVHRFGKIYEPKELMTLITGVKPDPSYFMRYITDKYSQLYQL